MLFLCSPYPYVSRVVHRQGIIHTAPNRGSIALPNQASVAHPRCLLSHRNGPLQSRKKSSYTENSCGGPPSLRYRVQTVPRLLPLEGHHALQLRAIQYNDLHTPSQREPDRPLEVAHERQSLVHQKRSHLSRNAAAARALFIFAAQWNGAATTVTSTRAGLEHSYGKNSSATMSITSTMGLPAGFRGDRTFKSRIVWVSDAV